MSRFALRTTLILWPIASFVLSLIQIFLDRDQQWDLRNYLNGLKAYREGLDPYLDGAFIYPPVYLPILNWLTRAFTYDQLFVGLLALKVVGFAALLVTWAKYVLPRLPAYVILPVIWLGFYATFAIDFYAGNVSVFETLGLFLGFACLIGDRLYAGALLIALAATAKIAPIVFLVALLIRPRGQGPFAAGVASFCFYLGFNYGTFPKFSRDFVTQAWSRTQESKLINPSSLAFIRDALPTSFTSLAPVIWFVFAVSIYALSWRAWRSRGDRSPRESILFLILVYVVTVPRMKDYAFMLAIPSVIFALTHFRPRRPEWLLILPLLLNSKVSAPVLFETPFALFWGYYPLAVALGFWALFAFGLRRRRSLSTGDRPC